jgi:hypothetical protein
MKLKVLFLLLACSSIVFAQKARISDITISSGRGALSSGIDASINIDLDKAGSNLVFEVAHDFVQGIYTKQYGSIAVGPSAGFFENAPWVGPYLRYTPTSYITFVTWEGISAGLANAPAFEVKYSFAYNSLRIDLGPFWISHTALSFQSERLNQLTGAGFTVSLADNMSCSIGCDYSLRDQASLFSSSLCYRF